MGKVLGAAFYFVGLEGVLSKVLIMVNLLRTILCQRLLSAFQIFIH